MPITDLTGYTWVGNSIITWNSMMNPYYTILFTSNNENFKFLGHRESPREDSLEYTTLTLSDIDAYDFNTNQWSNSAYKTINITGGTDATNAELIEWLEANGTLTAPIQANTYNLTHTLTNLTKGNITLQITPDTNYTYPTSLTISNGTIVSYDNTTGVAVISGDDTTIVSGECGVAPSLISFTTFKDTYQAESGMTWAEWVDSEYNTDGFYIAQQHIYSQYDDGYLRNETSVVHSGDIIVDGTYYAFQHTGGSAF